MNRKALLLLVGVTMMALAVGNGPQGAMAAHGGTPMNYDFETPGWDVGTPPPNHNFATGDFTNWTKTGTAVVEMGWPQFQWLLR